MTSHQTTEDLVRAFTTADCMYLAREMAAKYELEVHLLGGDDIGWIHAMAFHPGSDLYIDINGAHTADQLMSAWDGWEFDGIYPEAELGWSPDQDTERLYADPIDAAVELTVARCKAAGLDLVQKEIG